MRFYPCTFERVAQRTGGRHRAHARWSGWRFTFTRCSVERLVGREPCERNAMSIVGSVHSGYNRRRCWVDGVAGAAFASGASARRLAVALQGLALRVRVARGARCARAVAMCSVRSSGRVRAMFGECCNKQQCAAARAESYSREVANRARSSIWIQPLRQGVFPIRFRGLREYVLQPRRSGLTAQVVPDTLRAYRARTSRSHCV
jgi:hypothetical protein